MEVLEIKGKVPRGSTHMWDTIKKMFTAILEQKPLHMACDVIY